MADAPHEDRLPALRASDADRERTAHVLRRAGTDGRLTFDELEERLDAVYAAVTVVELEKLTADVLAPAPAPATAEVEPAERTVTVRRGEGGPRWIVAVLGGSERKGRWRVARSSKVVNFMGGSTLDFTEAELADQTVEMTVYSIMGGAELRVPDGLNVELSEFNFMGGNDVKLGEASPAPGGPTLRLKLVSIMGGTTLVRGRKPSRAERRALRHGH